MELRRQREQELLATAAEEIKTLRERVVEKERAADKLKSQLAKKKKHVHGLEDKLAILETEVQIAEEKREESMYQSAEEVQRARQEKREAIQEQEKRKLRGAAMHQKRRFQRNHLRAWQDIYRTEQLIERADRQGLALVLCSRPPPKVRVVDEDVRRPSRTRTRSSAGNGCRCHHRHSRPRLRWRGRGARLSQVGLAVGVHASGPVRACTAGCPVRAQRGLVPRILVRCWNDDPPIAGSWRCRWSCYTPKRFLERILIRGWLAAAVAVAERWLLSELDEDVGLARWGEDL